MATIKLSWRDVIERRAFVRLPGPAKVKLLHMAGAPWNEKKPNAELSKVQKEAISRPEAEKIIHGGSGLGKSVTGGAEMVCEMMIPNSQMAIGASRYEHVASEFKYVHIGLRKLFGKHARQAFPRLVFRNQPNYHEYEAQSLWGSRCVGGSTDADEGAWFLGKQFDRVVLGEGSHVAPVILHEKILRALDRSRGGSPVETGYLSIYTTPRGYDGCSASEWERVVKAGKGDPTVYNYGKVPFPKSVWLREASVIENPDYDRASFEARRETLDKTAFEEQYLGRMTFKTGIIFRELDQLRHVRPFPPHALVQKMRLGVGIDTGSYFGAVLYGLAEPAPRLRARWALGEVYTEQATITDSMQQVKEMVALTLGPAFGLGETVDCFDTLLPRLEWVIDPASQHKMEITDLLWPDGAVLEGAGLCFPNLELEPSIEKLRDWIKHDELFLAEIGTETLLDQMRKYVWKTMKAPISRNTRTGFSGAPLVVSPKKGYDHLIDALRLVALALEEIGPREKELEPLTWAQAWEQRRRSALFGPLHKMMERADARGGIPC